MIVCDRPCDDDVAWQPGYLVYCRDHATQGQDRSFSVEDIRDLVDLNPIHIPNLTDKEQDA